MDHFNFEDERETLQRRRREIQRQLGELLAQKGTLEQATFSQRHNVLLSEIQEVEQRLADLYLDEQSALHMEGRE